MSIFDEGIRKLEKESNSILETLDIIENVTMSLNARIDEKFLPVGVRIILKKLREEGQGQACDQFVNKTFTVYEAAASYILMWSKPFAELKVTF